MESAFRNTCTYFLLAFVVLALCVGAFAQGGVGELAGQVTDSTGAVVSGVEVKLTNTATGEVRTTISTPAGTYRFPALPIVGSYTLEIAAKGFKSTKVQNIIASVGVVTTRDVKLEIGAASEQVTVEAGAQLVQTEDSSLSQNIDSNVWTNMPLETRSQNEFMGLLPGAVPAAEAGLTTDRGAAVNGTRSGSGNFMVEGFDNNDQGLGGGGAPGRREHNHLTRCDPRVPRDRRYAPGRIWQGWWLRNGHGAQRWNQPVARLSVRIQPHSSSCGQQLVLECCRREGSSHPQPVWRISGWTYREGQVVLLLHHGIPSSAYF